MHNELKFAQVNMLYARTDDVKITTFRAHVVQLRKLQLLLFRVCTNACVEQ